MGAVESSTLALVALTTQSGADTGLMWPEIRSASSSGWHPWLMNEMDSGDGQWRDPAGGDGGGQYEACGEDAPDESAGFRMEAASGFGEASAEIGDEFAASVARNLAVPLQRTLTQQLQPVLDAFRAQVGASIAQAFAPLLEQSLLPELERFRELAGSVIPQLIRLPPLKLDLPTDWFPPNWEKLPDLDINKAISIIVDEGVPLVWVPQPDIVTELAGASTADERDVILIASRGDIAADCLTVIGEISDVNLTPLAGLAAEAVRAMQCGHSPAAQALAGNVFDTLLRDTTRRGVIFGGAPAGYFQYGKVRNQIELASDETVIRRFRPDCVLSAALSALQQYEPSDPPPARFARHATAHRACPEQYTPLNAVVAVMLMTSMLREAQASGW